MSDTPLPEWVRPDLWLDDHNAIQFYTDPAHEPNLVGATWWHVRSDTGEWHAGGFRWVASSTPEAVWDLVSLDPLTISPSLHCLSCGAHGFIRDGKWVPA